jgi:predicted porin
MIGGLLKSTSRLALVAAAGVIAGGIGAAQAADLGGDCCADLEERVAELEATTARKGNRKVSLTVYGVVSEEVMFWDDGGEQNAYVVENGDNKNRFGFRGSAKIDSDWTASFQIEYQVKAQSSDDVTQLPGGDDPNDLAATLSQRLAFWTLTSKTFGAISVGQQNTAGSGITTINLSNSAAGSGDGDFSNWGASMFLRRAGTTGDLGLQAEAAGAGYSRDVQWKTIANNWGSAWTATSLSRRNVVKYVTPTFGGFSVSAAWGEDDVWDVALRYAGDLGQFRLAAGIGYAEVTDETSKCARDVPGSASARDCNSWGGSASIMHVPTGLYVSGGAAQNTDNNRVAAYVADSGASFGNIDDTDTLWWIQVGIEQKFNALGKTTIYGQYWEGDVGGIIRSAGNGGVLRLAIGDPLNPTASSFTITHAETSVWGVGIVQSIDAAAMDLYIHYQNNSTDLSGRIRNSGATVDSPAAPVDDLQLIGVGATIKF